MELQAKHTDVILQAKTSIVSKIYSLVQKMDYGDDVCPCMNKTYAAILLINRLECYSFATPNYNCIEDSDLPKMYSVLSDLLK